VQDDLRPVRRRAWGKMFGLFIQSGRKKMGYSVEEAACLAAMEPSAWEAVEGGRVPEAAVQLRMMAGVLSVQQRATGNNGLALPGCLGGVNLPCCRPGFSGALAAGTHNRICSPPEEGGESDQEEGRNRGKTREHQYPNGAPHSFKAATAAQGLEMTVVLLEFIENYVAKSGYAAKPKSRRA
jgi:hypothetical protein